MLKVYMNIRKKGFLGSKDALRRFSNDFVVEQMHLHITSLRTIVHAITSIVVNDEAFR